MTTKPVHGLQWVWWGWHDFWKIWPVFWRPDVDSGLRDIYRWGFVIGPLEVRRWK